MQHPYGGFGGYPPPAASSAGFRTPGPLYGAIPGSGAQSGMAIDVPGGFMATPPVGQRIPFAQSSSGGHPVPLPDNLVARDRPGQRDVSPTPGPPGHSPVHRDFQGPDPVHPPLGAGGPIPPDDYAEFMAFKAEKNRRMQQAQADPGQVQREEEALLLVRNMAQAGQGGVQAQAAHQQQQEQLLEAERAARMAELNKQHAQMEGHNFVTAHPLHRVGAPKSMVDRAAEIPATFHPYLKPASAKPVIHPPAKWHINDATRRDPVQFLSEVYTYALQTGQEAVVALFNSVAEENMKLACQDILTGFHPSEVSWRKCCEVFMHFTGRDIFDPRHEATMALANGTLRQGKQSVLEYALHVRATVARAERLPPAVLCAKFTQGLRPELSQVCKRTDQGHIWTDLDKCISHAVGKEATLLPKPVHAAASAVAPSRPRQGNRFSGNKRPRQSSGPVSQGTGCFLCGSQDHWKADCPHAPRQAGASRGGGGAPFRGGGNAKRGGSNRGQFARRAARDAAAAVAPAPAE